MRRLLSLILSRAARFWDKMSRIMSGRANENALFCRAPRWIDGTEFGILSTEIDCAVIEAEFDF
jgi:hypothetical protein